MAKSQPSPTLEVQHVMPPASYSQYDDLSPEAVVAASQLFVEGVAAKSGIEDGGLSTKYAVIVEKVLFAIKPMPTARNISVIGDQAIEIPPGRTVALALLPASAAEAAEGYRLTWRGTSIGKLGQSQIVFDTIRGTTIRHALAPTDPVGCFFGLNDRELCRKRLLARFGVVSTEQLATFDSISVHDPGANLTWMLVSMQGAASYPSIACPTRTTARTCASRTNFSAQAHLRIRL